MPAPPERRETWPLVSEFVDVASLELGEPLWIVAEPLAQLGARGECFLPLVKLGVLPRNPARPEAIDKDSVAVR